MLRRRRAEASGLGLGWRRGECSGYGRCGVCKEVARSWRGVVDLSGGAGEASGVSGQWQGCRRDKWRLRRPGISSRRPFLTGLSAWGLKGLAVYYRTYQRAAYSSAGALYYFP